MPNEKDIPKGQQLISRDSKLSNILHNFVQIYYCSTINNFEIEAALTSPYPSCYVTYIHTSYVEMLNMFHNITNF